MYCTYLCLQISQTKTLCTLCQPPPSVTYIQQVGIQPAVIINLLMLRVGLFLNQTDVGVIQTTKGSQISSFQAVPTKVLSLAFNIFHNFSFRTNSWELYPQASSRGQAKRQIWNHNCHNRLSVANRNQIPRDSLCGVDFQNNLSVSQQSQTEVEMNKAFLSTTCQPLSVSQIQVCLLCGPEGQHIELF